MEEQIPEEPTPKQEKDLFFTGERVNLMLALCAIIISAASFYATYLQANAAERQVKAATWPWLQFGTGNFNTAAKKWELTFELTNSGAGPANIKYVAYHYQNETYTDIYKFLDACCNTSEYEKALKEAQSKAENDINVFNEFGWLLTEGANNTLLSAGDKKNLLQFSKSKFNQRVWDKLEQARQELETETCYCSLLDQCYISINNSAVKQVEACTQPSRQAPAIATE